MIKEEKIDKIGKKAEKILTVNHILELREKVPIPAGSAELVKVRVEENWKNEELVESMLPEEQEAGRDDYYLSGSIPAIYMKNQEDDNKTLAEKMNDIQETDG